MPSSAYRGAWVCRPWACNRKGGFRVIRLWKSRNVTRSRGQSLVKFNAESRFHERQYGPREGVLVLTGMPRAVLGKSCTTSIKDFDTFSSSKEEKK